MSEQTILDVLLENNVFATADIACAWIARGYVSIGSDAPEVVTDPHAVFPQHYSGVNVQHPNPQFCKYCGVETAQEKRRRLERWGRRRHMIATPEWSAFIAGTIMPDAITAESVQGRFVESPAPSPASATAPSPACPPDRPALPHAPVPAALAARPVGEREAP